MMENAQEKKTLEERMKMAANSQASSPEAALKMVQRFSRLHTHLVFHNKTDVDLMCEQIGPYIDKTGTKVQFYAGFCHSINLAAANGATQPDAADAPFMPDFGTKVNNALVLLGLMLLDHLKGREKNKEFYHCTRMNLGQYVDALGTLIASEDARPVGSFQNWRDKFLKRYNPSASLGDVQTALLQQYIHGWKAFDALDHVLRLMEEFAREKEQMPEERWPDLTEHYMKRVNAYCWDMPNPAGEDVSAGDVRGQIFLPDRDFRPQTLRTLAAEAPAQKFQNLLNQLVSERQLSAAMSSVNQAVSNLFMLWVGPYLLVKERPQ